MDNDNIIDYVKDLTSLISHELIVGDEDSISVFGSEHQQELGRIAKEITQLFLNQNSEIETYIGYIMHELDEFQVPNHVENKLTTIFIRKALPKSALMANYNATLKYINKLEVELKLQEANLIKETSLLELLKMQVNKCGENLKEDIKKAQSLLQAHETNINDLDTEYWWHRLERKIDDLKISYTISLQTSLQLQQLVKNNEIVKNREESLVMKIIPLWKSQMNSFISLVNYDDCKILNESLKDQLEQLLYAESDDSTTRNKIEEILKKG